MTTGRNGWVAVGVAIVIGACGGAPPGTSAPTVRQSTPTAGTASTRPSSAAPISPAPTSPAPTSPAVTPAPATPAPSQPTTSGDGQPAPGSIVLPAGSSLTLGGLSVLGPLGQVPVSGDGSFTARTDRPGRTAVDVVDAQGRIVLMGFVDSAKPRAQLSAQSTSLVLLYLALGGFMLPEEHYETALDLIAGTPEAAQLARAAETRLAANPTAVSDGDAGLLADVLAARDAILAPVAGSVVISGSAAALAQPEPIAVVAVTDAASGFNVVVQDTDERSGITILANPEGPGIVAQNSRRRDVSLYLYQIGTEDANGTREMFDQPRRVGDAIPVPATRQLNVFRSTLDAFTPEGRSAWAPVLSAPVDLPSLPNAARTFYFLVGIGPTIDLADSPPLYANRIWFGEVDAWRTEAKRMAWRGLFGDWSIPFLSFMFFGTIHTVSTVQLVQFEEAFRTGAESVLSRHGITDPTAVRARSKVLATLIEEAGLNASYFDRLQKEVAQTVGEAELNAERATAVRSKLGLWSKAALILAIVDAIFSITDLGATVKDLAQSSQAEAWRVDAIEPPIKMVPSSGTVTTTSPSAAFQVQVKGEPNAHYLYRWSTTGHSGVISDYLNEGLSVDSSSDKAFYLANDPASISDDLSDTVTVEVFADPGTGSIPAGAAPIGKAQALVKGNRSLGSSSGGGRLVQETYVIHDNLGDHTRFCASYSLAWRAVENAKEYVVHGVGFTDPYGLPFLHYELVASEVRPEPTPGPYGRKCPPGGLGERRGNEIFISVTGFDSFEPIESSDIDFMLSRFKGLVLSVEAR